MPLKPALRRTNDAGVARLATLLSLVVATGSVVLGVAPAPAVAAPSYTLTERALAIASPSLLYLESVYTGYVRDKTTHQPLVASPVTYNRRCSGFVVNSEGYVVTTRNCVAPTDDTVLVQALYLAGNILVGQKRLDGNQVDGWVNSHQASTVFTGRDEGSKPEVKLFAQLNIATGATTDKPAIPATVVKSSDANDGDVSVVKLDQGNLSGAELATNVQLATGLQLTVLGFNTTDSDPRIGRYTLESQSVQVVESGKLRSATFYRLNKTVDIYYRGGMVIDTTGRVVGIVDADPDLTNNQNRIVYPVSTITPVLKAAGVHNTLGDSDKLFRAGLDAYFNGRYKTAIGDLDEVAKAVPTNLIAPQYRQNAVDRQKIEGDTSSGMPGWLVAVIAAVGGALFATAAVTIALRARSRRRSRRRQQETEWEPRYPLPPAPPARPGSGDALWATAYGPVSAPPTSGPPLPAPVSGSPASAPPVSSPPLPYQPDPMATQPVAWPPANAIPVAPSTMDTPAAPDPAPAPAPRTPNVWAPESAPPAPEPTPPVTPVQPADRQSPESPEPIVWQQRPIRRRPAQDEPDGGEQPANPWAVPPPQH